MSDNDRAIEMGLIDFHGNILVDDEEVVSSNEMIVELTPSKYLPSSVRGYRYDLDHQQDAKHCVSLKHARYNNHDNKALAVYYFGESKDNLIGYVRENSSNKKLAHGDIIDEFCFSEGVLNNISIQKKMGTIYLRDILRIEQKAV